MSKKLSSLLLAFFFVIFVSFVGHSQTTNATLSGVVEDPDGRPVPGVKITITNPATGLERVVVADASGAYVIPLLPPAKYTVMAEATGFRRIQIPDVVLNVNDRRSLRIELQVGEVGAEVLVRPDDGSLVTVSPEVSTTVDRTFVGNLPLSGRSFQSLILLTPGIVYTPSMSNAPGEFSVNGQRSNANYFTVDGVSGNTFTSPNPLSSGAVSNGIAGQLPGLGANGSTSTLVSVDALEEFKIQTSSYSAQYGRQPGGQVQLSTRSGGNGFHGTLFEYVRNEAFDARNWFNKEPARKPPTRLNQYGGTFSGPVYLPKFGDGGPEWFSGKDRTFFFFSFEGQRLRLPVNVNQTVPSVRLRTAAPSQFHSVLNAFPLPTGDEIFVTCNPATAGCSPQGTRPSGMAPFVTSYADPKSQDATSVRIDHRLNKDHAIFGRYNYAPSNSLFRNYAALSGNVASNHMLTLGWASSFGSTVSNDFRFNRTRSRSISSSWGDDFGGAVPIDVATLLPGYTGDLSNVQGRFHVQSGSRSVSLFLGDSSAAEQLQYNIVDNLTWTKGRHAIVFGFDFRRLNPTHGPLSYRQWATADITSFAQQTAFINGTVSSVRIDGQGLPVRPRFDNLSAYVQDTWKISDRLTLDLGLRWELNPTPSEASGRSPVFVTDVANIAETRLLRSDEAWYKTDYTALAPRVGAAYLLRQKAGHETVLRGGFGVYYDLNGGLATAAYAGFPFVVSNPTLRNVQWPITAQQSTLNSQPTVTLPITSTLYAINHDLRLPYTLQWNLSLEQSLGKWQTVTIGYVASAGRQLTTNQRLNQRQGNPDTGPRPNSNFGDINFVTNGPASDYHSMQAQYQRRLWKGFQALVNYTWSHAIDEVSNEVDQGMLLRGNASFDVRHNFTAAVTYQLPRWKRYKLVDAILRDWSLDAVALAYSGRPLDILVNVGAQETEDGVLVNVRPDLVPGVPVWIEDNNAPGGRRINADAFAAPPILAGTTNRFARAGTLGRNVVRAPGIHQINLSLRREIGITERIRLHLRGEAFNLLNTPLFSGYGTAYFPDQFLNSLVGFGRATTTLNSQSDSAGLNALYALGGPRSMQFSARLTF